jgi:hypothetical protein
VKRAAAEEAAEEVAQVLPDLVQYDSDGEPLAIRYHFVNAMLLNEVQKQHAQLADQGARLLLQQAQLARQQREIDELRAAPQTSASANKEGEEEGAERPAWSAVV